VSLVLGTSSRAKLFHEEPEAGIMVACLLWLAYASGPWAREAKAKFGPNAISIERSRAYLQRHAAPD
jgi:hypothetical protein